MTSSRPSPRSTSAVSGPTTVTRSPVIKVTLRASAPAALLPRLRGRGQQ
ncbi:hypothetical protein [Nonomuraea sp. NPDC003709]